MNKNLLKSRGYCPQLVYLIYETQVAFDLNVDLVKTNGLKSHMVSSWTEAPVLIDSPKIEVLRILPCAIQEIVFNGVWKCSVRTAQERKREKTTK